MKWLADLVVKDNFFTGIKNGIKKLKSSEKIE